MIRLVGKDPVNGFIRHVGIYSPRWGAELLWQQPRLGFARRIVETFVGPSMTVVDIGASQGAYTNRMAKLVGRTGRVHAFEPDPPSARALRSIARRYPWISVHQMALSDRRGSTQFYVPVVNGRRSPGLGRLSNQFSEITGSEWQTLDVAIDRLDTVLAEASNIAFIKCDVEGHEYEVLCGARSTLQLQRPHVLVEIEQRHQQRDIGRIFSLLTEDLGYIGYAILEDGLLPIDRFDVYSHQLRLLASPTTANSPPWEHPEYVNDFLFLGHEECTAKLPIHD